MHRFMHVCQVGCGTALPSQFWQWPWESSFCSSDFPREQKDLRSASMPTDLWVFLRAAGLLYIALDSQLEMKDSYPNSKMPGKGLGLKVFLVSSLLLCLISVVLFFALWFDPWLARKKLLLCHSEPAQFTIWESLFSLQDPPKFPYRQKGQGWYERQSCGTAELWGQAEINSAVLEKPPGHLRNRSQWLCDCSAGRTRSWSDPGWKAPKQGFFPEREPGANDKEKLGGCTWLETSHKLVTWEEGFVK